MKRFQLRNLTMLAGLVAGLVTTLALGAPASATLLGNPLQFPLLSFDNTGSTEYDAATDLFRVQARPIALRLDAATAPIFVTAGVDGEGVLISILVDASGALVGGIASSPDLEVHGRVDLGGGEVLDGSLLTAEVTGFGFQENGTTDLFDFSFTVTGGLLAARVGSVVGVAMQSERSTFADSFRESFHGGAKGTIGVIPEPTTLLLLGAGIAGLTAPRRRRPM